MNDKYIEIREFGNKSSIEIKVFWYSLVVGSLLVCLIVLMNILRKDLYYQNNLVIKNNHYAIMNVLFNDLDFIENNNYLIINNKKYYYDIYEVELINDINLYYQVNLNLNNKFLENSVKECKILVRKESLFNYIVRIVKGG